MNKDETLENIRGLMEDGIYRNNPEADISKEADRKIKKLIKWRNKWGVELLEGLLSKRLRYPTDDHYKEWKSETDGYVSAFEHGASTVRVEITKLKQQYEPKK